MDGQVVAAVIGGVSVVGASGVTGWFAVRAVSQRIGTPNGKGNVVQMLERLHDWAESVTEAQYEMMDRQESLEARLDRLEDTKSATRMLRQLEARRSG